MVSDDDSSVRRVPAPLVGRCRPAALLRASVLSSAPSSPSRALQSLSVLSPAPLDSSRTLQSLSVLSPAPSVPLRALLRPSNSLFTFQSLFEPSPVPHGPSDPPSSLQTRLPSFRDLLVGSTEAQLKILLIEGGGFEVQSFEEKDIKTKRDVFAKPPNAGYKLVGGENSSSMKCAYLALNILLFLQRYTLVTQLWSPPS